MERVKQLLKRIEEDESSLRAFISRGEKWIRSCGIDLENEEIEELMRVRQDLLRFAEMRSKQRLVNNPETRFFSGTDLARRRFVLKAASFTLAAAFAAIMPRPAIGAHHSRRKCPGYSANVGDDGCDSGCTDNSCVNANDCKDSSLCIDNECTNSSGCTDDECTDSECSNGTSGNCSDEGVCNDSDCTNNTICNDSTCSDVDNCHNQSVSGCTDTNCRDSNQCSNTFCTDDGNCFDSGCANSLNCADDSGCTDNPCQDSGTC